MTTHERPSTEEIPVTLPPEVMRELQGMARRLAAVSAAFRVVGERYAPRPKRHDWAGANVVHIGRSR